MTGDEEKAREIVDLCRANPNAETGDLAAEITAAFAAVREECAKECDGVAAEAWRFGDVPVGPHDAVKYGAETCAAAIRKGAAP